MPPPSSASNNVSRVGGKTQAPVLREAAQTLRLDYAQFLELEMFTRFGGVTDVQVKGKITRGQRIRAILSQPQYASPRLADEVALVLALQGGLLDRLPLEDIGKFRSELPGWLDRTAAPIVDEIERTGRLDDAKSGDLKTSSLRAGVADRTIADRIRAKDQVMAERLADIVTQIENVRQLDAVVTAMRGIAASRAQKS